MNNRIKLLALLAGTAFAGAMAPAQSLPATTPPVAPPDAPAAVGVSTPSGQTSDVASGGQDDAARNGDIIVTAQKRAESVQRVPISITAVDGATLAQAHVSDLIEMKRLAPTFRFNPTSGTGVTGARLSIRSVGTFTSRKPGGRVPLG